MVTGEGVDVFLVIIEIKLYLIVGGVFGRCSVGGIYHTHPCIYLDMQVLYHEKAVCQIYLMIILRYVWFWSLFRVMAIKTRYLCCFTPKLDIHVKSMIHYRYLSQESSFK